MMKSDTIRKAAATAACVGLAAGMGCDGNRPEVNAGGKTMVAKHCVTSGTSETARFAVAWSGNGKPAEAAREATQAALTSLGCPARGVVFYTYYQDPSFVPDEASQATACKADVAAEDLVAATVNEVCGGVANLGCRARPLSNGGTLLKNAVAVMAVGGAQTTVTTMKTPIQDDRLATGRAIAEAMKAVKDLKLVLALAEMRLSFEAKEGVSVEDFIRGVLENTAPGTTLFGGNSMPDDMASAGGLAGKQFFNGEALKGHVVAMGIGGDISCFGNHANEFAPSGRTAAVTETKEKWIVTLDDKPAELVYRELTGMGADDELSSDWLHPIGVDLGAGKNYTRMILNWVKDGKDKDGNAVEVPDGSLCFVAPVAKGAKVFCLACGMKPEPIIASARKAVSESVAAAQADGKTPALCLLSDCCARGMRLRTFRQGNDDEVVEAVIPVLGSGVPIFGFYAWGELGRIQGTYQGMDHQYQQHTFVSTLVGVK